MHEIEELLQEGLSRKLFPGYGLQVKRKGVLLFEEYGGLAQVFPKEKACEKDTIFDLASLTKGFCTAVLILWQVQEGHLDLHSPIAQYLPDVQKETGRRSIHQLLTHTGGLPPVPGLYRKFPKAEQAEQAEQAKQATREEAERYLLAISPLQESGLAVIYSCTGFLLLGLILHRLTGQTVAELFAELCCELHTGEIWHSPAKELESRCAATEFCPWRKAWTCGVVHDENAYCMHGNAGNAGLFATLQGLSGYAGLLFDPAKSPLTAESLARMQQTQSGKLLQQRSYGLALRNHEAGGSNPQGCLMSEESFGHTGFTGTSFYCDPLRELQVIFLTNRLHYGREVTVQRGFLEFRPRLHDAIVGHFCG